MLPRWHKEKGAALLIEMLICLAIAGVLLASLPMPVIKLQQNKNESATATALATVNFAEYSYMRAYGGFIGGGTQPLLGLSGILNSPLAPCANPMMLPGLLANLPATNFQGYKLTFTGNGTAPAFTCPGGPTTAYTGYSIALDPEDLLAAKRHFFSCTGYASCDGLVHFNDGQPAAQADPIFNTAVIGDAGANSGSTGNNNGPSGASTYAGTWNASGSYGQGAEVTLDATTYSGYTTNASGPFFNITGVNGGWPPGDTADWLYCCGSVTYQGANPTPTLTGTNLVLNQIPTHSTWAQTYFSGPSVNYAVTYSSFSVSGFGPASAALFANANPSAVGIYFAFVDGNNGEQIQCSITESGFPISSPSNTGCNATGGPVTVNPGDTLYLNYWMIGSGGGNLSSINGPLNTVGAVNYTITH